MDLGIKELYYKDTSEAPKESAEEHSECFSSAIKTVKNSLKSPVSPSPKSSGSNLSEKCQAERVRKQNLLKLNHEDSEKTALRKRANKIFNNYLKEIDSDLYLHIQDL